MIENYIKLYSYHIPDPKEPYEVRHELVYNNLRNLPYPFNFDIKKEPPVMDDIAAVSYVRHQEIQTLLISSRYIYRSPKMYQYWVRTDELEIPFNHKRKEIDYKEVLYKLFPMVINGYKSNYRSRLLLRNNFCRYLDQHKKITDKLHDKGIERDGVNNIFILHPAQHWSNDLCKRALGYDAEEAMRRLRGAGALMVEPMLGGLYCVLNDDRALDVEGFKAMNLKFKTALGLHDGTIPRKKILGLF